MRFARKLVLLAAAAMTIMALSATSASAVEVTNESLSEHCGPVSMTTHGAGTGGCVINAINEGLVRLENPLGSSLCSNTFTARVDEAGSGFIQNPTLGGAGCNLAPCAELVGGVSTRDIWPVNLTSETTMEADFCVVAFGFLTITCHLPNISVNQTSHTGAEFSTRPGAGNPPPIADQDCENPNFGVQGHWIGTSPGNGVEIID